MPSLSAAGAAHNYVRNNHNLNKKSPETDVEVTTTNTNHDTNEPEWISLCPDLQDVDPDIGISIEHINM